LVNPRGRVYGRAVTKSLAIALRNGSRWAAAAALAGCTTVDPGPNFVVPDVNFDSNYFYCHVEPEVIFNPSNSCGDRVAGSCHFTSSAVSGMVLINHPLIDCGGGDVPLDMTQTGVGGPAASNLDSVSIVMDPDYTTAPFYLRPTQQEPHPLMLFAADPSDPNVMVIATWAQK
jgi:hypothetical protein